MSKSQLANSEALPHQLSDESKELLSELINKEKASQEDGCRNSNWNRVTKDLCDLINELYDEGWSGIEILDYIPFSSPDTVYTHINEECEHIEGHISYDDCGWIRRKAKQGVATKELAEEYDVAPSNIRAHAKGNCRHSHGLETVSGDEMYRNSRSPDLTTSICPVCKEEFEHKAYRDRTTCSKDCNVRYAAETQKVKN